jgi:ABC-type phosphate transport system permease subunit
MESTTVPSVFDRRRASLNTPLVKAVRLMGAVMASIPFAVFGVFGLCIAAASVVFFYKLSGM